MKQLLRLTQAHRAPLRVTPNPCVWVNTRFLSRAMNKN